MQVFSLQLITPKFPLATTILEHSWCVALELSICQVSEQHVSSNLHIA